MDEIIIRALVIGFMFAAVGFAASMAWKLIRSDSEGARRARQVIGVGIALLLVLGFITGNSDDRMIFGITAFILGGGYWIFKGTNKS